MKTLFSLLLTLSLVFFLQPIDAQVIDHNGQDSQVNFVQGNIAVYYVIEGSGIEIPIPCGQGVNFNNQVPVGGSYSALFRIYPEYENPNNEEPLELTIHDVYLQTTDFHFLGFPNGFDGVLTEGESLDVRVFFKPICPGVFTNGLVIESSAANAPVCLQRIDQITESGDGAQLSVSAVFPSEIGLQEWTVIPATQGLEVPAFPPSINRRVQLDIQNFGNEDLIIDGIYVYGPASLNNTHPSQSVVFAEPIPPGQQRFVWIEMDEEIDCDGQDVQVLIKSTDNITCGPSLTNHQFKFFVYPSEDCPEEEEEQPDDNEDRPEIRSGRLNQSNAPVIRVFPTLVSNTLWVELGEPQVGTAYQILDGTGRMVLEGRFAAGDFRAALPVQNLRSGHYFLRELATGTVARFIKP
ncbi:hypothetical protein [Lewinella sp. W8]|uniref:hypothetical protein n=1 Tax=Lewinella sp. W8 TaxID=2528208 RepID=UPI0010686F4A|nr:hypothetical protein [Lewinella sp. W8]MTB53311.1 hypothetical protein [Lewinella sp. W8]